ncbi:MAG TPA: sensor histidine kinase [Steroidobacteraceae bacterium]|nr:sensor histidine kinase [Steroidobacteraceae bacterium]
MADMHSTRDVPRRHDATPEEQLHELRQRTDARFFEHRRQVRDLLAVIRAIVRRTAPSSGSVEDFAAHLEGRLGALARVQEILMRVGSEGADLAELVSGGFLAEAIPETRFEVAGPRTMLSGKMAASLALALHELTTNAIKFGALSTPHGRVSVRWARDVHRPERIRFEWQERGISILTDAPRPVGFGTELIEKTLPYELRARTALDFAPGGVRCLIKFRAEIPVRGDNE